MVTRKNTFYFNQDGTIDPEAWLNHAMMQRPESRLRLIRHAIALSQLTGKTTRLPLGMTCLQQSLNMADLLLDLLLDEETVAAALVYSGVHYAELGLSTVQEQLGSSVAKLLRGALRMENISSFPDLSHLKHNQLENFRKMLLAMADDMRVVLIKLAERTALIRAAKQNNIRNATTRQYAQETLTVYAPLANRLGIDTLRCELEDLAMEKLAPCIYKNISHLLQERLLDRENYVEELSAAIEIALSESGIQDFSISCRVKHLYSIYRKMRQKKLDFHEIHDLNALRITVNTIEECYQALNIVQRLWTSVPGQLDDYIATPKENGYRSLHAAIYGSKQKIIEIQVRTYDMHQESEHGVAAHWQYKEGGPQKPSYQAKIAWLRQILAWQKELVRRGSHLVPGFTTTLDDRVYVLTPSNDILDLPKGATPLDFAYHIHSEVGHYCNGAKVNGAITPLTYTLKTGDQIEILTSKQPSLSWDWLNPDLGYLHTAKAKAKVLHWFKLKDYQQHAITGQRLLETECRQLELTNIDQEKLAEELHFKSRKDFLAVLGSGELHTVHVLHALHRHSRQQLASTQISPPVSTTMMTQIPLQPSNPKTSIIIEGIQQTVGQLASCCKPIPGDIISGLITQRGVVLHRRHCNHITQRNTQTAHHLVALEWPKLAVGTYPVDIHIEAQQCPNLLQELSILLRKQGLNLVSLSAMNHAAEQRSYLNLTVEIQDTAAVNQLLVQLTALEAVISAQRQ